MRFQSAESVGDALQLLGEYGDEIQLLAGGSDVMAQYHLGDIQADFLLHLERIEALRSHHNQNGDKVELGALMTHRMVGASPELGPRFPALAEACRTVGGWQTQEVGTIVGNVANASPAADTIPVLLTANAVVRLASARGERTQPLEEFLLGRRRTTRQADEMITGIALEPVDARSGEVYLKVAPRSAMEVAVVGLAMRLTFADDGSVGDARVAVCSVAPVAYRPPDVEAILKSSRLEKAAIEEAGLKLTRSSEPIDDNRASAAYRKRVLAPLLARAVQICRSRALQGES